MPHPAIRQGNLSTGDSPTGGGNSFDWRVKYPSINSAQVIPRQGVETRIGDLLKLFFCLSTGDSPTGGGNLTPHPRYRGSRLSTGDSPTGGGNSSSQSKTSPSSSAQVIPRQGVETHGLHLLLFFVFLSTGDSPTGGGNNLDDLLIDIILLSTGDSPTGGGNVILNAFGVLNRLSTGDSPTGGGN